MEPRGQLLKRRRPGVVGFTLIEIVLVLAILGILASLAVSGYRSYVYRARSAQAIIDMRAMQTEIDTFEANVGRLPVDLAEVDLAGWTDPWGNPYRYTELSLVPVGKARKDKFLVPINSDYDLWSEGGDGASLPPLTAPVSRDDIIRANDGSFFGRADGY